MVTKIAKQKYASKKSKSAQHRVNHDLLRSEDRSQNAIFGSVRAASDAKTQAGYALDIYH